MNTAFLRALGITKRRNWGGLRALTSIVAGCALLLAACAPAASPQPTAAKPPAAITAPPVTAQAATAASPVAKSAAGTEEWDRTVAAAKQEGKVAVLGPTGPDARDVLTGPFEAKYGISVEFLGASARETVPRLQSERDAGQYLWDIVVQGALEDSLGPLGALDAIEPALILPDVKDPRTWRGNQIEFGDDARTILIMSPFQRGTLFVNPSIVHPDSFSSYRDLLDPKYRGKIGVDDPRVTGPGQATFTHFYLHPDLGPDFIRALARQEPTIMKDFVQETDAVAQGRIMILLGTADFVAIQRAQQGVPVDIVDPRRLKEGADVSPANGTVALVNRAPHPNAAKVYLNWLLSQEGQTGFVRALGYVSARLDVPTDHAPEWRVPRPGAIKSYGEALRPVKRDKLLPLLEEVFGKA